MSRHYEPLRIDDGNTYADDEDDALSVAEQIEAWLTLEGITDGISIGDLAAVSALDAAGSEASRWSIDPPVVGHLLAEAADLARAGCHADAAHRLHLITHPKYASLPACEAAYAATMGRAYGPHMPPPPPTYGQPLFGPEMRP